MSEMPNLDKTVQSMVEKIEGAVASNQTLKWNSGVICDALNGMNAMNDYKFCGWFNRMILALASLQHGDPRFIRKEAAFGWEMKKTGAHVRKGAKMVWAYQPVITDFIDEQLCGILGIPFAVAKKNRDSYAPNADGSPRVKRLTGFRQIAFFNVKDMENFFGNVKNKAGVVIAEKLGRDNQPIEVAENFFRKLGFKIGYDPQPHYQPKTDTIGIPKMEHFDSSLAYYSTLAHEVGHWSGAASRLNRAGITDPIRFGSEKYGFEELVACLTSVFLMNSLGLEMADSAMDNETAYLANWIKPLKNDPRMIYDAAIEAERAVRYLHGLAATVGTASMPEEISDESEAVA